MTLLIHEGNKAEYLFLKDGTFPDPRYIENDELKCRTLALNMHNISKL